MPQAAASPFPQDNDEAPRVVPAARLHSDAEALDAAHALAADFAQGAAQRDRDRSLPWREIERYSASGLGGITVPREYDGAQVSHATLAEVFRIISAADPSLGQIPQNHFGSLNLLRQVGTPQQKQYYYEGVLAGRRLGNAGPERHTRHARDVQARLVAEGNGYRLSGRKYYSTGALYAHWIPTKALDTEGRLVTVLLDRGAPGLTVVDDWSSFGQRTTASGTVLLDNVRVEPDAVLPAWAVQEKPALQGPFAQLMQAAIDAGIAEAALNDTVKFLRERARPWAEAGVERATQDPYVIGDVGRLFIDLHAAQAVLLEAAAHLDDATPRALDADDVAAASIAVARAKALTTEIALAASETLFELSGSRSSLAEFNLDRHWRNARTHTLHDPVRWKYHAVGNYLLNGRRPNRHSWI
ncbi:SfnB family sulfur acquisition oxidoreductase [Achromobacter deleyi]|uniref:SfnB family sulfur acquisition oxidoreductase n=1 Tax=Achromobacter deleyi TaxID=1353891 RepID=UPI0014686973|nr:SfnB family sulfur acquisition oxidoreductase [Achromobacter deleyi]CAB3923572.1 Dibenzothiophene desulfurization enzyme C [Achromobacter deleyi]